MRKAARRVGRRGAVLLTLAFVDVGAGWSYIVPTAEAAGGQNALWRDQIAPTWVWGLIWISVGLMCAYGAFFRQDIIGFVPAVALKLLWATVELTGWLAGEIDQGYRPALVWTGYGLLIYLIAGLQERPPKMPPGVEEGSP